MEVVERVPLIEWLANNYKSFGTALEIITDKSQEGSQFCRGFGGIGGIYMYISVQMLLPHTHTHTHTHIYISQCHNAEVSYGGK